MVYIGDCLTSSNGDMYQITGLLGDELSVKLVSSNWSELESVTDIEGFNDANQEFLNLVTPTDPSLFYLTLPVRDESENCILAPMDDYLSRYFQILHIFEWKLVELKEKSPNATIKQKKYHLKQFLNQHIKQSFKVKPFLKSNANLPPSGKPLRLIFDEIIRRGLNIRLVYFLCNNRYDSLLEFVFKQLIN